MRVASDGARRFFFCTLRFREKTSGDTYELAWERVAR